MFCKFLLALLLSLSAVSATALETLAIDYQYNGEHGVDFSNMPGGPLTIADFSDARAIDNARFITDQSLGDGENRNGYQAAEAISELVRSALVKGFEAGGAKLAGSAEKLVLTGEVIEVDSDLMDGEITVTIKAKVELKNDQSASQLFSAALFGRASVPQQEGLAAAVSASLDKLVNNLLWDDYFLMHVID